MQEKLQEFARLPAHRVTDSCIVALLSHGVDGGVYGVDGKLLQVHAIGWTMWFLLRRVTPGRLACAAQVTVGCLGLGGLIGLTAYLPFFHTSSWQLQEVFRIFDNANCPSLQNKPKVFFIQACRGGECPG